jgi:hypothetical protein
MKKTIFIILTAFLFCFGSSCIATGQAPVAQSDQITDGDTEEIIQDDNSSTGSFETVTVDASANSDVKLQFPISLASKTVAVEAPDGGTVSTNSVTIDTNGNIAFSFQVSDQPGIHRVIVIDPNADEDSPHIVGVVQFEVPSPTN